MLNTVMALWNQNPGENRQRVVKLLFTFLFISVSIFLLLFTLNSAAWSSVTEKGQVQAKKEVQAGMSNHNGIATAGNTPASNGAVAGITPAATSIPIHTCVQTPRVVVQSRVAPPQVVHYFGNSGLNHKSSKSRHVRPKLVHVRGDKPHPQKRPQVKIIAPPAPQKTLSVVPPPLPVPTIPPLTVTPHVTGSATVTAVPTEGTVASSVPDIVIIDATPDMSMASTNSFAPGFRQKGAIRIPVQAATKSTKKSAGKKNDRVHEDVECSGSTIHKDDSTGTTLKEKGHVGLLLGGSLLGILLFCCFVFAWLREGYSTSLKHFKISSKNPLTTLQTYVIIPESSGETPTSHFTENINEEYL